MGSLTYGQLEQLWDQAGGPKPLAPLMAAIALAESAGNPAATNPTDNNGTQTSWGLWQISDGTHNQPSADILTPLGNARAAVAKYHSQGLGAWGTYTSGAYKKYYSGNTPPSSLPQGGGGTSASDTSSWWSALNPVSDIENLWKTAGSVADAGGALSTIAKGFSTILHALEWFFVPSHWVRIAAGAFGIMFLLPGLFALMKASQGGQGDIILAMGILLVTIAGMLLFIAFHNLPDDVRNLQQLIAWLTTSIRAGKPAASAHAVIPDTGLGAQAGQVAGGAV